MGQSILLLARWLKNVEEKFVLPAALWRRTTVSYIILVCINKLFLFAAICTLNINLICHTTKHRGQKQPHNFNLAFMYFHNLVPHKRPSFISIIVSSRFFSLIYYSIFFGEKTRYSVCR